MEKNCDDLFYTQVADEISKGQINEGLWLKATVETNGNDLQSKLRYTKLRINQLKEEVYDVYEQRLNDIEKKPVKILNSIGYHVIFNKGGLLTSDKWLVTIQNEQVTIKSLDELISFAKKQEDIFLCEKKHIKILNSIGYHVIFNKGGLLTSDKWLVTTQNKKVTIKSLDELVSFTKKQENIFLCKKKLNETILLCQKKLDNKGYILSKYGSKWCITDYLGNKKTFNSIKDLELFSSSDEILNT